MKREDAEEFTQSLGQMVGATWRLVGHGVKAGYPKALGMTREAWLARLGDYGRPSHAQLPEAIAALKADGLSNRAAADVLQVDESTVREHGGAGNPASTENPPSENQEVSSHGAGNPALTTADKRKAGEDARKAILETPADPEILPGIYAEDFFTGSRRIADDSVDLIFTDPPYDSDSSRADLAGTSLYRKAAQVAARILKPGGSFIAYSGQKYLPEVYGLINHPALRYWWTFAGVHGGGNQLLQKLGIRCGWKPIVWYVKGTRGNVSEVLADVVIGAREKEHHKWQQAEAEALHFIEKLTFSGSVVVDFFLGGGTTKVACDRLGRRFIGFEIDRSVAEKVKLRVAEAA